MTHLPDNHTHLRERIDQALADFLCRKRQACGTLDTSLLTVCDAIESFVLKGGKRFRPIFGYWGYRGAGGTDNDHVVASLAALELLQASALIHDDVMDDSDIRRGEPSIHRRFATIHRMDRWHGTSDLFGLSAAILVGDLCLVWAGELLNSAGLSPSTLSRARPVFDLMCTEVTLGQYLDIQTQAVGDTSTTRASLIAQLKSAKYTVERPLLLGAAIADASEEVIQAYSAYGSPLGEAFQLRDDVLGIFGDPSVTGKPAGDDLREGKRTYLIASALDACDEKSRYELMSGLGNSALDEVGIMRLRDIIVSSRALAVTEHRINDLHHKAVETITKAPICAEARSRLTELAHAVIRRCG